MTHLSCENFENSIQALLFNPLSLEVKSKVVLITAFSLYQKEGELAMNELQLRTPPSELLKIPSNEREKSAKVVSIPWFVNSTSKMPIDILF
jgi:hypothetical protein